MDTPLKTEIDGAERATIFHEQYGNGGLEGAADLPEFIISAGDYIASIVGAAKTNAGMAIIVKELIEGSGNAITDPNQWRVALKEARSSCYSDSMIGPKLHDLAAYAEYGIVLHDSQDEEELANHIESLLTQAQDLLAKTPISQWGLSSSTALSSLVFVASNRWALDHDEAVEPSALAYFGGISEGRVRNLMSGESRVFSAKDGKISAQDALKWLTGRSEFWNSIWREQSLSSYSQASDAPLEKAGFVPVARDGSMFHPNFKRGSSYTIGKKGAEEQVADFYDALARLQRMPVPYWRRPNANGNWGSVAGVRWERVDLFDFKAPANDRKA